MATEKKAFLLRLPADLHDELRRWADAELRSLNAQVEFVLRRAVQARRAGAATAPPARPQRPDRPAK